MAHRRHQTKSSSASIMGAIAGFLLLAGALFAAAFASAGLITAWLGLIIALTCLIPGIVLIVRHIRSHQTTRAP